jgi:hypothetical protein
MLKKLLGFGWIFIFLPTSAHAAMCVNGHPSLDREYQGSKYVVEASVKRILRDVSTSYVYDGRIYHDLEDEITLQILTSYKNSTSKILIFRNPHDSAALPVKLGIKYLLFLSRRAASKDLYVDTCGSSGPVDGVNRQNIITLSKWSKARPRFVANHD